MTCVRLKSLGYYSADRLADIGIGTDLEELGTEDSGSRLNLMIVVTRKLNLYALRGCRLSFLLWSSLERFSALFLNYLRKQNSTSREYAECNGTIQIS